MPNKHRGEVALPVKGGATYTVRFSLASFAEIETQTGLDFNEYVARLSEPGPKQSIIQKLLWAGLREFHPEITEVEAGRLGLPKDIVPFLMRAMNGEGSEEADDDAKKNPPESST
jgi:hypothetical protein